MSEGGERIVLLSRRGLATLLAAATVLLAGCTTGTDAVDVTNGGQFRFVSATPSGELIAPDDRGSAPAFGGTLLDGAEFDSSSLSGSVAVLNFWGQWCAPCRVETPQFQQVYDDVAGQGVEFLGINVKDNDQQARAFLADNDVTFPSLFDPRGEMALIFRDYPPSAIPSTILLDRDGNVAAVYLAAVDPGDLRAALDTLLAER